MGVASKDVQMTTEKSEEWSDTSDKLLGLGLSDLSGFFQICQIIFAILFGELTLSDSMMSESTLNSFLKNSATFCVPIPNSLTFVDPHCEHEVGTVYWVLQR
jgi:hypothetical protein